jgi:hypothetical protein
MSMSRRASIGAVVLAFLVLVPGVALAQSGIAGVVRDTSAAVLPGVTVEATSPALIEKVRTVVTDSEGRFNIVDLRPGVYAVTFTLAGFSTVRRDGIELPAGFTATVNADLQVGSVEETITVTGAAPLVDVQNVTSQQLLSSDLIEAIPSARSIQGYAILTPGVIGPAPGTTSGSANDMQTSIHGAPTGETIYAMDGMTQGSLQGAGGQMMYRNAQAYISEINIITGGGSAEQAYGAGTVNIVPKEGGNSFTGSLFGQYSGKGLAFSNLTDELKAQGFTQNSLNNLLKKWEFSGALGGRLVEDKLWFFGSYTTLGNIQTRAGVFDNLTPKGWQYTPDFNRPAETEVSQVSQNVRLTWQATPKHKFGAFVDIVPFVVWHRRSETSAAPEATSHTRYFPASYVVVSWKSPATSRLLFEATGAHIAVDFNQRRHTTETCLCSAPPVGFDESSVSIFEATTNTTWRSVSDAGGNNYGHNIPVSKRVNSNVSYITGSHAAKAGVQLHTGTYFTTQDRNGARAYTLRNGLPTTITQFADPTRYTSRLKLEMGLFAQDQWTLGRMTLTGGLRYDYYNAGSDAQTLEAGIWVPERSFPATKGEPLWKDWNPRFAVAYDLLGDGRTAIKGSLNRSVAFGGRGIVANHPISRAVLSVTRTWNDANRSFSVDCDLTSPVANGECGAISNTNFGQNNPNATTYDPRLLKGERSYNWESTIQVQRQVTRGASVQFGFYRRSFANFQVTDNTLVTPADFSPYCVTAPVDARLPNGGGYQVCGLQDVNPALFGRNISVVRPAEQFGKQSQIYNGYDITTNLRLPGGGQVNGGASWSRTYTNACFVVDSPAGPNLGITNTPTQVGLPVGNTWPFSYCEVKPPFQPNVTFVGFYPLRWGITASATYRNAPPTSQLTATYTATNAEIAPSLGRNLASGVNGTVTVELIKPGTRYAPRPQQLDLRLSKRVSVGRARFTANMDLFNILNATGINILNTAYGAQWQRPTLLQQGRYTQLSGQIDF